MSSLFNHIFIPVVILLLFSEKLKLNSKEIIALGFFAVFPDIDFIFFHIKASTISLHRILFHNVFILFLPLTCFIFIKSKRHIFGIICFYLASHLILDLFTGGIFLFYPVYNNVFFAHLELSGSLRPMLEYGIRNKVMNNGIGEAAISSENIAVGVLIIAILLITYAISAIRIHRKTE